MDIGVVTVCVDQLSPTQNRLRYVLLNAVLGGQTPSFCVLRTNTGLLSSRNLYQCVQTGGGEDNILSQD